MKIFIVIDKPGTAIDRLAQSVKKYSPHFEIEILAVHPKRPDAISLSRAVELMEWCDVIDVHYWKSGEVLRQNFKKQFDAKPKILFHFNPYDADNQEVNSAYDLVVVGNNEIHSQAPYAHLIPYGVDLDTFKFNEDYTEENVVNMTVARIEGKKGVREVAQVCNELGYKFKLVGRISKPGYMDEVRQVGGDNLEFFENVTDEKMLEIYRQSAIHVCNSVDGFESGTLPILESMIMGVPVLTRGVGHVPDLLNDKNMVVRTGEQDDVEDLNFDRHPEYLQRNVVDIGSVVGIANEGVFDTDQVVSGNTPAQGNPAYLHPNGQVSTVQLDDGVGAVSPLVGTFRSSLDANGFVRLLVDL